MPEIERITCVTGTGVKAIELVLVPAGPFAMGTRDEDIDAIVRDHPPLQRDWVEKEAPRHERHVGAFLIGRAPVTRELWSAFLRQEGGSPLPSQAETAKDHPAWGFDVAAAERFCGWVARTAGRAVRIPTEAEWEKAARGTDAREWPWGNVFDASKCNTLESGRGTTIAVGSFPDGASPCGALDMAGNVEEWTADRYAPYPGGRTIRDNFGSTGEYQIVRGGSWQAKGELARCARRHGPGATAVIGLRLALDVL